MAGGPFFDDLARGDVFTAPTLTLGEGHAALHQAISGDRLALALDDELSRAVTGAPTRVAHPALVWDVAIGQSSVVTQRVVANLFYRGLVLRRLPVLGDTLRTRTEIVALRQNTLRPGRASTGLAALRIVTTDQADRVVLDFHRCAMLPLRDPEGRTGHADDLAAIPSELDPAALRAAAGEWRLDRFRAAVEGPHFAGVAEGDRFAAAGGDVVSAAPELARLTLNIAAVHHDRHAARDGRRLVFGGHTIGLAAAQLARALPGLVTIAAWHGCDHLAPVHEGDTLTSEAEVERREPLPGGGGLVHLRCRVRGDDGTEVLDWRPVAVLA